MTLASDAASDPLTGDLLEVAGRGWSALDAVLHGMAGGEWGLLEDRVARGLAGLRAAMPADEAVEAELTAFRRGAGLLAAADLRARLETLGLTRDDLIAYARRAAARAADPDPDAPADEVAAVIGAEALLDGTLASCATALAQDAAVAAAHGETATPDQADVDALADRAAALPERLRKDADLRARAGAVLGLVATRAAFTERTASPERLARLLRQRRLGLTSVRAQQLTLATRGAAAEAVLCVNHDGAALPEVAARAGAACHVVSADVEQLGSALRAALESARPGDLAGPVEDRGAWLLLGLLDRAAPTLEDPAVRDRLSTELVATALERSAAGTVEWRVAL